MIVYRHWERHQDGEPDLSCPVIVCDACRRQIVGHGNVYWIPNHDGDQPQLWFTHKWPCSELDRVIGERLGEHVCSAELDVWLDQLTHNTIHAEDPIPGDRLEAGEPA